MKTLEDYLVRLREVDLFQIDLAKSIMQADSGKFYSEDFVYLAALNRSRSNIDAFICLLERQNFLGAAPFIRMQLDTVLRLYALRLVDDPSALSHEILKGQSLNKKKTREGEKLHDGYLREEVAKKEPWIRKVYESGSGFIHLSEKHIFSLFTDHEDDGTFQIAVGPTQKHIDEKRWIEAVAAMSHTTELVISLCLEWAQRKDGGREIK